VTWVYGPDVQSVEDLGDELEQMGFPVFTSSEKCIRALGLAYRYAHGSRLTAHGAG
jgi:hypothetical protein